MKTNLKDNIWIEGYNNRVYPITALNREDVYDVLYAGKTSEIPEDVVKECLAFPLMGDFVDYSSHNSECPSYIAVSTIKESIQSACDKPYCIIYKTN